jgi:exodeoxyribonuclease VIII
MTRTFEAKPGVYPDLPNSVYHASAGISKTGLCRLDRAPIVYRDAIDNPGESRKTRSLVTGSVFHMAMEGAFERECAIGPEVKDKRQKEWKDFVRDNAGKICLTPGEARDVFRMRESLLSYGPAHEILAQPGQFECSFYWNDPGTRELCKCRPDWISENLLTIIDFKTCQDATEAAFVRAAERYHYHVSAAMTMDGIREATGIQPLRYIFLAIEPQSPYLTAAYEATADDIERGRFLIRRNHATFRRCIDSGTWPGLPEEVRPLNAHRWRGRHEEDEGEDLPFSYDEPANEWWKQ